MKKTVLFGILLLTTQLQAQTPTFTTNGKQLIDPCGTVFLPRGVNYSLADDWNFPDNLNDGRERSSEIVQANPNTVRIQWYVNYGNGARPALTLAGLDSVLTRFARAHVVSILELHDFTHIHTDTTAFNNQIIAWWTSPEVVELIDRHKNHLLLNVANEYGPALYPAPNYTLNPNYATEITAWVRHYKSCIHYLRDAGITVPIIIDAPNYGMDHQAVIDHGVEFKTHDPLNRVIMSCHAYWNVNAAAMESIVAQLAAINVPVIFGEVGNVDFSCNAIEMTAFLAAAQTHTMGWLAWTWNRDECPTRNMTANDPGNPNSPTDGKFVTLAAYGHQIVHNATYGLATTAIRSDLDCSVGMVEISGRAMAKAYPNPATTQLILELDPSFLGVQVQIEDVQERKLESFQMNTSPLQLSTVHWKNGIYFVTITQGERREQMKCVILH